MAETEDFLVQELHPGNIPSLSPDEVSKNYLRESFNDFKYAEKPSLHSSVLFKLIWLFLHALKVLSEARCNDSN